MLDVILRSALFARVSKDGPLAPSLVILRGSQALAPQDDDYS
jgi:hypothetical protein